MQKKAIMRTITFSVRLTGATRYSESAKAYVAFCPALNVYSQGLDEAHAERALAEAIRLYLNCCYRRGILHDKLTEAGFQVANSPVSLTPEQASEEYTQIRELNFERVFDMDVPLPLIAASSLGRTHASLSSACA